MAAKSTRNFYCTEAEGGPFASQTTFSSSATTNSQTETIGLSRDEEEYYILVSKFEKMFPFSVKVKDFEKKWTHRFSLSSTDGIDTLRHIIDRNLLEVPALREKYGLNYSIGYWDNDGYLISIITDNDLTESLLNHKRKQNTDVANLIIYAKEERAKLIEEGNNRSFGLMVGVGMCLVAGLCSVLFG